MCHPFVDGQLGCFHLLKKMFLFNEFFFFLAALDLCCCTQAFSSFGERGLLSRCGEWASHGSGFFCGAWALGTRASVLVAHGLHCSMACGIFPDQGSNLCHLH